MHFVAVTVCAGVACVSIQHSLPFRLVCPFPSVCVCINMWLGILFNGAEGGDIPSLMFSRQACLTYYKSEAVVWVGMVT